MIDTASQRLTSPRNGNPARFFCLVLAALCCLGTWSRTASGATSPVRALGAGGGGAFTVLKRHPADPDLVFVGTDVAGVFRSGDGGASFDNVSRGLTTGYVADIEVLNDGAGLDRIVLATKDGIFLSDDDGDTWTSSNEGFETGKGIDTEVLYLRHPVLTLAVDPENPNVIWAGIGVGNRQSPKAFAHPHAVYVSRDAGETWSGTLDLSGSEDTASATVYEITVDPFSCESGGCPKAYVATNKGLFVTSDAGLTWRELENLPIVESVGATRPNLRAVKLARDESGAVSIFTALFDDGVFSGDPSLCSGSGTGSYYNDVEGTYARGGIFRSDDGGSTWESLNAAPDGSMIPLSLRCSAEAGLSYSTTSSLVVDLEVNPADPGQVFVSVDGKHKGVFEYRAARPEGSQWLSLTNGGFTTFATDGTCDEASCFYDPATTGLWNQHAPEAVPYQIYGMDIDFESSGTVSDMRFYGSRGVTRGRWESDRYRFDYMNQRGAIVTDFAMLAVDDWSSVAFESTDLSAVSWQSSGIDDSCNYGGLEIVPDESGREVLFLGMGDYGVIRSEDGGRSWKGLLDEEREAWPFSGGGRDGQELFHDRGSGRLYAAVKDGTQDENDGAVMLTEDAGRTWSNIGGYCGEGCDDKGLEPSHIVNAFAIEHSARGASRRLLAATQRGGLYVYDSGTWSQIESCPMDANVADVKTSRDFPGYALAAFQDGNNYGNSHKTGDVFDYATEEGVYLVSLADLSCTRLHAPSDSGVAVYHPSRIQIGRSGENHYVLVSGEWSGWPVLYRSEIAFSSPTSVTWQIAQDFYYAEAASGERISRSNELVKGASERWWDYVGAKAPDSAWEYQDPDFHRKEFAGLWIHPKFPNLVLASLSSGSPNFHGYWPQHVYLSRDFGRTFAHADGLDFLPIKAISRFEYDAKSKRHFVVPGCGQPFEIPDLMERISSTSERAFSAGER